jgi:hypothetical protein
LGRDGSDHALLIEHAALAVAASGKSVREDRSAALAFLGAQGVLSYAVAGIVKVASPEWRSGAALPGVLRTVSYGHGGLASFLANHPRIAKLGCWATIIAELGAPLTLILPQKLSKAYSLGLIGMHVGISFFMGLNRFLPAFAALHPGIAFLRESTIRRVSHRPRDH